MNWNRVIKYVPQSRYHLVIIGFYLCLTTHFFLSTENPASYYTLQDVDLSLFISLFFLAFITLYSIQRILQFGVLGINKIDSSQFILIILYASIFIAIPEEIFFRGYIHNLLNSLTVNQSLVVLISSTFFGMAHILNEAKSFHPRNWNWKLVTMSFVAGIYLGLLYEVTQSLLLPTILHALFVIALKIFIKRENLLRIGE